MTYKEARVYLDKVSEFAELVEEVQKAIVRIETRGFASPTVFEIETAIAFLYFLWRHGASEDPDGFKIRNEYQAVSVDRLQG